ncbi:hypothetical protein JW921_09580, partial [Candidatus Fermentibacterales bacterium]|nr:hypothetical protein [Candidatus Fermentibacterales bacterium]
GLVVFDAACVPEGTFVDPTVPPSEAVAQSERYARRLAGGAGRGLEKRWQYFVLVDRRCSLIYYPIWVVAFIYGGRSYQIVLDGVTGKVLRGRLPGRTGGRRLLAGSAAALWAASIPLVVEALVSVVSPFRASTDVPTNCLGVVLALFAGAAVVTGRLFSAMDELHSVSGDEWRL